MAESIGEYCIVTWIGYCGDPCTWCVVTWWSCVASCHYLTVPSMTILISWSQWSALGIFFKVWWSDFLPEAWTGWALANASKVVRLGSCSLWCVAKSRQSFVEESLGYFFNKSHILSNSLFLCGFWWGLKWMSRHHTGSFCSAPNSSRIETLPQLPRASLLAIHIGFNPWTQNAERSSWSQNLFWILFIMAWMKSLTQLWILNLDMGILFSFHQMFTKCCLANIWTMIRICVSNADINSRLHIAYVHIFF